MSPARHLAGVDGDAILNRAKRNRAVRRPDAHIAALEPVDLDAVPAPYLPRDEAELDEAERVDLATCERAIVGLQKALAVAGKALATINQARLYRETHATFADYVEDRWGMKRTHAYRLIEAWPVAAAVSPMGDTNERQVRELMPAAKRHGVQVATAVFKELREQGGRLTAARIREAVRALPARVPDPDMARYVIRQAVREGRIPPPGARPAEPVQPEVEPEPIAKLRRLVETQRAVYDQSYAVVPAAMAADPGTGEELMRELRAAALRTAHRNRAFGEPATHRAEEA